MAKQVVTRVCEMLKEKFPQFSIGVKEDDYQRNIMFLSGEVDSWQSLVDVGHAAAKVEGVKNVVSDMTVKGINIPKKDYSEIIAKGLEKGEIDSADVVIVGLGIVGCGIARELAKYDLKIIALDMASDVAAGASKANNGGVHMAGMVKPGTLKAKLSVRGNQMYDKWAEELGFELIRTGNLVYTDDLGCLPPLVDMFQNAVRNKDKEPAIVDGEGTLKIAPEVKTKAKVDPIAALWMPSQAKVHPYQVCVALAENAAENGVKIMLGCAVGDVLTDEDGIRGVVTDQGIIKTRYLVNAAGIYGDDIAEMAGDRCFTLHNRRGTLVIIDKHKEPFSYNRVMQKYKTSSMAVKNEESKGGATDVTPSGNILIGPSAKEVADKEDTATTREDLDYTMGRNDNPEVTERDIIRLFAGARPADFKEDFIVESSPVTRGLITAGAIQSPGIGSSPAIAEMVEELLRQELEKEGKTLRKRGDYQPYRKKRRAFAELSREEQAKLIEEKPEYGRIICRCETITEGEILDAIHSPVVPTSIDAIKRRTRAGMGRCQGGFCQPRVLEILARELGKEWTEIHLKDFESRILEEKNR